MANIYDMVVLGAGSGGLTAALFGSEIGARVALVERKRIGGDCTWTGCIPSKSLLKAAKVAHTLRTASPFGIDAVEPTVDFAKVMARVHRIIETTYAGESPDVLREEGLDVVLGEARFVESHTVMVGDVKLTGRLFVIATGARPFVPPIPGIDDVAFVTSDTVWELQELPKHLMVIGGGPIGCELCQAFRRLGSRVTMLEAGDRILQHDEPEASALMLDVLRSEGVDVRLQHKAERVSREAESIHVQTSQGEIVGDALLIAVGRRPNVESLGLDKVNVAYSARGIEVDDHLRTSQKHIYAVGDCLGSFQFTHYADWQGRMAARNALLPGASKGRREWVPWTTFTEPEVAHAGLTEAEARDRYGPEVETITVPIASIDRARAEDDGRGFIKVVHKGSKALGVTAISARAGETLHEWIHVLEGQLRADRLASAIHVYPTYSRMNVWAGGRLLEKRIRGGLVGSVVDLSSRLAIRLMRWRYRP